MGRRVKRKRALERRMEALERKLAAQRERRAPTQAEKRASYDVMVEGLRAKLAAMLAELGIVVEEPVFESPPSFKRVVATKKVSNIAKPRDPDKLASGFSRANAPEVTYEGYGDLRGSSEAEIRAYQARRNLPDR